MQLHEDGSAKGVPPSMADTLRKLVFAIETAETLDQLSRFPGCKLRLVFRYGEEANTASEIDLIDYH